MPLLDEEDEHRVWTRYHEIVLDRLDVTRGTRTLAQAMTAEWVSGRHIEPFPWTIPVLNALASHDIPVVVLSDAWPSLRGWFRQLGLDSYIQAMVISGEEGVTKAETRVFDKAVGLLGRDPADVVFVDDYPDYVRAAEAVGLDGLRLRHPPSAPAADLDEITSLGDLLSRLDSNRRRLSE